MLASLNSLKSVDTFLHVFFGFGDGLGFIWLDFHLFLPLALVFGFFFGYFTSARH